MRFLQRFRDEIRLELLDDVGEPLLPEHGCPSCGGGRGPSTDLGGQRFGADDRFIAAEDDEPFENVHQLADVTWVCVDVKTLERFRRETKISSELPRELFPEMFHE